MTFQKVHVVHTFFFLHYTHTMPLPGMSDGRTFGLAPYVTESSVVESNALRKKPENIKTYEDRMYVDQYVLPTCKK
jgi:hypothetical protein